MAGAGTATPFRTSWTADELMAMTFPETRWAVPGVIAEGLNLLAGPPKVGKSWLSLGTAIAVAGGGKALEAIDVEPGPVLYLALEDTPRRLQSRMSKILGEQAAPRDLTLATSCPTLPQGGDDAIARWLERNPGARMVVIDVFAKVRGTTPPGLCAYDADYTAMSRAKRLADTYGVAVVLVHHVRKMRSDDFPGAGLRHQRPGRCRRRHTRTQMGTRHRRWGTARHRAGRGGSRVRRGLPTRRRSLAPAGRPTRGSHPAGYPRGHRALPQG
ncbi:AAA family ATPase [Nonomuraea sp. NPDC050536]|uniref:AAA family ATPase n=1 Tax=Nonomuraea sp. NPDC050536 TaxID=3364366 RepID=UPI0037C6662C